MTNLFGVLMNNEDKELLESAKMVLNVASYKDIAKAIGMKENCVINWSNRGLSKLAKLKISQMISSKDSQTKIPKTINSYLSDKEIEILQAYRELEKEDQEIFYHKLKAAAAEARKKAKETSSNVLQEDVKSAV